MPDTWTAIYISAPNACGRLNVKGECISVGGETFTLQKQESRTGRPGTLVLHKIGTLPTGTIHDTLARTVSVTYEEDLSNLPYSRVEILPDGITVPVREVVAASPH